MFDVFDPIPLILLQPIPQASPPQLRCHQPPVFQRQFGIWWSCNRGQTKNKSALGCHIL
jgi:hypothetical protein